jgi:four helix bundle protein
MTNDGMTNDERMTKPEAGNGAADFDAFWQDDVQSSVIREETAPAPAFDLEERTAKFGEAVINFAKTIPQGPLTNRLVDQLVGCGTSVGANYCEADDAVSKKEFLVKINTCRKEARETKYFLRMIVTACPQLKPQARLLWLEAKALHLIFSKIRRTGK